MKLLLPRFVLIVPQFLLLLKQWKPQPKQNPLNNQRDHAIEKAMLRHSLFCVGDRMSIRIETLQQLQNPTVLETVLDRLRRTTQPRQFAYKRRCKAIGDKPLLLTAHPTELKSSLLRQMRLGTLSTKVSYTERVSLIFTFKQGVNPTQTV